MILDIILILLFISLFIFAAYFRAYMTQRSAAEKETNTYFHINQTTPIGYNSSDGIVGGYDNALSEDGNPYNTYGPPHVYTNEHTTNVPAQNTNVVDTTNDA